MTKHWIVDVFNVTEVRGEIVYDMANPATVCMTCRKETGAIGPCLREITPALTVEEINAISTLPELHAAARTTFGSVPGWILHDIAKGEHAASEQDNRRKEFARARMLLAYGELHRRVVADPEESVSATWALLALVSPNGPLYHAEHNSNGWLALTKSGERRAFFHPADVLKFVEQITAQQ